MEALSREIAQELTQPLLEQWGLTQADLEAPSDIAPNGAAPSEPITPRALLYDKRSRMWTCPRCERFSNVIRRSVTTHLRFCTAAPKPELVLKPRKTRRSTKKKP